MKVFLTLLWLENRKNRFYLVSLAVATGLLILVFGSSAMRFKEHSLFAHLIGFPPILVASIFGGLGLFLSVLAKGQEIAREGNGGQLHVLILTPASGITHILARFVGLYMPAALAVFATLSIIWMRSNTSSIGLNGFTFYGFYLSLFACLTLLPLIISYSILAGICVSAYSLRGNSSAIKIFIVLASFIFMSSILLNIQSILQLPILKIGFTFLVAPPVGLDFPLALYLPIGFFCACGTLSLLLIWLAGRIWDEVEI